MVFTPPKTWAGEVGAADFNIHLRDQFLAMSTYTAYTPSLSTWAKGNGSISGRYIAAGEWLEFWIEYAAGSTSTFGGNPNFGLPPGFTPVTGFALAVGVAHLADVSTSARACRTVILTGAPDLVLRTEGGLGLSATTPWTWASGDIIEMSGKIRLVP